MAKTKLILNKLNTKMEWLNNRVENLENEEKKRNPNFISPSKPIISYEEITGKVYST